MYYARWGNAVGQSAADKIRLYPGDSRESNHSPRTAAQGGASALSQSSQSATKTFAALVEMCAGLAECQAAVMYLIDDSNQQLTVTASWGLDASQQAESRPLRGARVDLEVLLGHVVTVHKSSRFPVQGRFKSAVCLPLANEDLPLGTLWVFSKRKRSFTEEELVSTELVAERLAREVNCWLTERSDESLANEG